MVILSLSRQLEKKKVKEFDPSSWISQAEAAEIRGVSRQSISELVSRGRLSVLEVGGKKLLDRHEVETFQSQSPGPAPKTSGIPKTKKAGMRNTPKKAPSSKKASSKKAAPKKTTD